MVFFSFLVRYNKPSVVMETNMVLVLDEPGLTEGNRAQAALLTYFSRELTPKHQLIYSTHLSTMIDPTLFLTPDRPGTALDTTRTRRMAGFFLNHWEISAGNKGRLLF